MRARGHQPHVVDEAQPRPELRLRVGHVRGRSGCSTGSARRPASKSANPSLDHLERVGEVVRAFSASCRATVSCGVGDRQQPQRARRGPACAPAPAPRAPRRAGNANSLGPLSAMSRSTRAISTPTIFAQLGVPAGRDRRPGRAGAAACPPRQAAAGGASLPAPARASVAASVRASVGGKKATPGEGLVDVEHVDLLPIAVEADHAEAAQRLGDPRHRLRLLHLQPAQDAVAGDDRIAAAGPARDRRATARDARGCRLPSASVSTSPSSMALRKAQVTVRLDPLDRADVVPVAHSDRHRMRGEGEGRELVGVAPQRRAHRPARPARRSSRARSAVPDRRR
jgi:hypothetical protein